jgi:hypothetical protein
MKVGLIFATGNAPVLMYLLIFSVSANRTAAAGRVRCIT